MKDSKSTAATDSTRGPAIEQQRKHQRVSSRGRPPLVYDRAEPLKRRAARVQKLFEELDRDRTGYIEYGDLKSKLQSLTPTKQLREETVEDYSNHFMERVDLNHDQKISFEEFSIFVESKERELWDLFSQLDSRGDGFIRRDDLVVAFKEAGIKIDRTGLDSFMRDVDRDGNGLIDFPELRDFLIPLWRTSSLPHIIEFYRDVYDPSLHIEFMPSVEPIPQMRLRSFLAGAISGAVSRTTVAPLERIQCLMNTQTHREFRFSRDFVDSVRAIWKQDHLRGFWRGNLVNVLRIAPSMSITFGVFEEAKRALARLEGVSIKDLSPGDRFVAGAMAGLSSMTVTYPFEVVQVRMMATINVRDTAQGSSTPIFRQGKAMEPPVSSPTYPMSPKSNFPSSASQVRSVNTGAGQATNAFFGSPRLHSRPVLSTSLILETVRSMWREGGVKRFYRGLVPSMLGIVPYAGLNLMTYETLKQAYLSRIRDPSSTSPASPSPFALLGIGVVATATGASVTYPLSAVRQRLQAQGTVSHPQMYAGMRDVFVRTFRNEGIKGFYRGLPASLAKALPSASISYVIYEVAKDALGVPKGE